jgi:hypothetical protein
VPSPVKGVQSLVRVRYLIDGRWHTVMATPEYIWHPLRGEFASRAGVTLPSPFKRQTGRIRFCHEGRDYEFTIAFNLKSIRIDLEQSDRSDRRRPRRRP